MNSYAMSFSCGPLDIFSICRDMLDEIGELTLTTTWKKVRGLIKDDPRYAKFSSSDRVISALFSPFFVVLMT